MRIKRAVVAMAVCVAMATGAWIGIAVEASRPEPVEQNGEQSGEVYSTEIWEDGGVRVYTQIRYVNQVSEHTLVISDHSLEDVWQEIGGVKK